MQNISLLLRWWWRLYQENNSLWKLWAVKLRTHANRVGGPLLFLRSGSFFWMQLLKIQGIFQWSTEWVVGNGETISFWYDSWNGQPLRRQIDRLPRPQSSKISLADAIPRILELLPDFEHGSEPVLGTRNDSLLWKWDTSAMYSVKSAYSMLIGGGKIEWHFNSLWSA